MYILSALTSSGLEGLLQNELQSLGAVECQLSPGMVTFQADYSLLYRSLLWSRLASRILLRLAKFPVSTSQDLYNGVGTLKWPDIFDVETTFMVHFTGTSAVIRNSQFGALLVKDAIVDSFRQEVGHRPTVERAQPGVRIDLHLYNNQAVLSLDLAWQPLHQRGYRQLAGQAPIKENLAAAIIIRSGWSSGTPLVDPFCGAGTLLIEAAMMAAAIAPGLWRQKWGFLPWKGHCLESWQRELSAAKELALIGVGESRHLFWGYDQDPKMVTTAMANARRAGVAELIDFKCVEVTQLSNPCPTLGPGTLIGNPPYGERLGSTADLFACYSTIGQRAKEQFAGWCLSIFSANHELLHAIHMRPEKQFQAYNGPITCLQKNYHVAPKSPQTVAGAFDFANRLAKNQLKFSSWAKKEGVDCYRLYDADLPDYNVAIDRYLDRLVIQEYQPPGEIAPQKRQLRLAELIQATTRVTGIPANQMVVKVRQRQRGKEQYQKLATHGEYIEVTEYSARLYVNLSDYLDTGLFLDHRRTRKLLGTMAADRDFLNLFCYTGSATVHAALGGARTTTSVDLSCNYLEWAEKNLRNNQFHGQRHQLIQADCLNWLDRCRQKFDLIFLDPPSFSNSKKMRHTLDVQRDHLTLFAAIKPLLRPKGKIIFTNNRHGFRLDNSGLDALGLKASSIANKTLSADFARRKSQHHCWLISG